jgi:hypothetical protein
MFLMHQHGVEKADNLIVDQNRELLVEIEVNLSVAVFNFFIVFRAVFVSYSLVLSLFLFRGIGVEITVLLFFIL